MQMTRAHRKRANASQIDSKPPQNRLRARAVLPALRQDKSANYQPNHLTQFMKTTRKPRRNTACDELPPAGEKATRPVFATTLPRSLILALGLVSMLTAALAANPSPGANPNDAAHSNTVASPGAAPASPGFTWIGTAAAQAVPDSAVGSGPGNTNGSTRSAASATPSGSNPYGLAVVWRQGDWVARITLALLALMSLGSWTVIVTKILEQRRQNAQALDARKAFSGADSLLKGAASLAKDSPYKFIVDSSLDSVRKHASLENQVDMASWLSQDIVRNVATLQLRMQGGLAILATVGSTAPFVGLFGTVWGIYNALVTIGSTGQASIDKVAGPVGEALIMTAVGLAVAVPAVLGYNWLVRRNRLAMQLVKGFGSDLHTLLLVEAQKRQRAEAVGKAST